MCGNFVAGSVRWIPNGWNTYGCLIIIAFLKTSKPFPSHDPMNMNRVKHMKSTAINVKEIAV